MISQPWAVPPYSSSPTLADPLSSDPTPFPPFEKIATVSSAAWAEVGPRGPSVGTGRHSVQVEGPGYLPIGISKQDIWETGLQHVQGQEGGFLHHLEEKGPRQMRTPGRAYLSDTLFLFIQFPGPSGVLRVTSEWGSQGTLPPVPPTLHSTLGKQCGLFSSIIMASVPLLRVI